jgi:two-component system chemotaxis sensor kinase CheA
MTHDLEVLINRCSAAALQAQPDELAALAQLHTQLQAICERALDQPAAAASASRAAELVEKLVLGDTTDATASLRAINEQIDHLQQLLQGGAVRAQSSVEQITQKGDASAPGAIADERIILESDAPLAMDFVGEAVSHLDAAEASLLKLEDDPSDLAEINAVFRAFHTIKGVAGFLELKQIGALAHATETLLDLARKSKLQLHGSRLDVVFEARDLMKLMVSAVEHSATTVSAPQIQRGLSPLLLRLEAAARGEEAKPQPITNPVEPATAAASPAAAPGGNAASATQMGPQADATVKVATLRLDALIDTVGELVIAQAMVAQDLANVAADQRLSRNLSQLGKITRSLQELSMSMRMVPIAAVFQKMARLARDVSRKAGKEVEFVQIGSDTELDRNLVEAISDPLVHMVRNAIDHGIEFPEDRVKAGKPRAATLTLKACHQAGSVVIEISDDGRGLPTEKIVKKAMAAGVVREGQALSDQEIFQLIFHPGLSTADKITDISGRGVGMDVVKKNVEALRGRIEIASTPGHGSLFTVRLPLTMAVIDGLIVRVGGQRYIIPINSIEQSIRPTAAQMSSVQGKGELCLLRDRLLPLVRLHELFKVKPNETDPTKALVVIVQEGHDRCCLLVDELVGQQQVVIKSVGKEIGELPGIAGAAILGDGNVSLILDVGGIINLALR